MLTTGEEEGCSVRDWLIAHFPLSLDSVVANLETEMIGRPDSLAGGPGKAWLTGYDRSTMGAMLARAHIAIVADPRPSQHFFERSDNIAFARARHSGAHAVVLRPARGLSPAVGRAGAASTFAHMTAVINSAMRAVELLANGPLPVWNPGGRPAPPEPKARTPRAHAPEPQRAPHRTAHGDDRCRVHLAARARPT